MLLGRTPSYRNFKVLPLGTNLIEARRFFEDFYYSLLGKTIVAFPVSHTSGELFNESFGSEEVENSDGEEASYSSSREDLPFDRATVVHPLEGVTLVGDSICEPNRGGLLHTPTGVAPICKNSVLELRSGRDPNPRRAIFGSFLRLDKSLVLASSHAPGVFQAPSSSFIHPTILSSFTNRVLRDSLIAFLRKNKDDLAKNDKELSKAQSEPSKAQEELYQAEEAKIRVVKAREEECRDFYSEMLDIESNYSFRLG
ncbi:hypothetical protein HS088_TW10G00581 [Tripterygium wilfordii]|uniref:Uncharacterized protein n=1 Tax=Tripterygium wilfordii TaxID=458696 RepID=A0A7J7D5G5_TRIWF|nr:hypothetical protein HS088_TW10G00581 [Tripterygium wilfordii]